MKHPLRALAVASLALLAFAGALLTFLERKQAGAQAVPGDPPTAIFYTNPGATTPQIPLWACYADGDLVGRLELDVRLWKTPAQLQSALLAGVGDIWLGHTEGIARAHAKGAPILLLAISGWRKMAILSRSETISGLNDYAGGDLAYTPRGSPAVPIARSLLPPGAREIRFQPYEPKQLTLSLMRGDIDSALAPEPLSTILLSKIPDLRVVVNLEDLYAPMNDGRARMPVAGLAVHRDFAARHPELLTELLDGMVAKAEHLRNAPEQAAAKLPESFSEVIPTAIVIASLKRDVLHVEPAYAVLPEIQSFLRLVAPELDPVDKTLVWRPPVGGGRADTPEDLR